ncbi:uncharacterized protein STEHIDRAFT_58703 [Stereum hirsutum FP-91666 SS1]|uniref:uncharacterized protein n=1 Tax=Stereum hirsutum (strain FP-91666) TaxID=721885 RepID=UPI000444948A|nr:uncharacterized protein STEHIDRAFT_58703 [Stereum hirsutum FP-91666 SS1]EIM86088.1 hypothetical protein STEHIDRAFT_58703 [Stereum hirsutum FP-91666 SS1]
MGAGQSTQTGSTPPSRALHVLRVTPSSPASHTNIEPFFDFVVGFDSGDASMSGNIDAGQLEKIVERHEGRMLNLLVWSSKNQDTRVVPITPSREWSQLSPSHSRSNSNHNPLSPPQFQPQPTKSQPQPQPSLLGLSMRMCEPEFAIDNVWHVLDVLEGSPAESAGLVPYGDWVLGWSGGVLSAEGDFYDVVEAHIDKPLRVYVYSYDFDTIREVVLVPNRQWGGEGLLGCVFGFVIFHILFSNSFLTIRYNRNGIWSLLIALVFFTASHRFQRTVSQGTSLLSSRKTQQRRQPNTKNKTCLSPLTHLPRNMIMTMITENMTVRSIIRIRIGVQRSAMTMNTMATITMSTGMTTIITTTLTLTHNTKISGTPFQYHR